jgi:hypothetical protein
MNVTMTTEESAVVRKALRSYLSDLRAEIVDTDNPEYKRGLREERAALESAVGKLDSAGDVAPSVPVSPARTLRIVEMWWSPEEH